MLREATDVDAALDVYRSLAELTPPIPHSLEAALRAGMPFKERGEYRAALKMLARIDEFRERIEKARPFAERGQGIESSVPRAVRQAAGLRQSRFYRWSRALGLYRGAIVAMAGAYAALAQAIPASQLPPPPRLRKRVPFFGDDRRVLTLQFIDGRSVIHDWKLTVDLRPSGRDAPMTRAQAETRHDVEAAFEGQPLGTLSFGEKPLAGIARPSFRYLYEPRHTLALVNNHNDGLHVVAVRGELGGEQTDLWWSSSVDGGSWSTAESLPLNSSSDDFAPRLVRAEDGSLGLFWLSNRRGLGWEIWTGRFGPGRHRWRPATRVPIENFVPSGLGKSTGELATTLLPFTVTQDRHGRWVLAYYSKETKQLVILASPDTESWRLSARIPTKGPIYNPAIVEDASGRYRLAAIDQDAKLVLWSSNELRTWRRKRFDINDYRYPELAATHPLQLYAETSGKLLLLLSDGTFGLQYARFHPDVDRPAVDLVKDAGLEAYAASPLGGGEYLVGLRQNDAVRFQRYRHFHSPHNGKNSRRARIYVETTEDSTGRRWRRIFARARWILPDVTTVGAAEDGRVWWGIETGVMALRDDDFFFADVASGFFHHYPTHIVPCGARTAFASRTLDVPVLGLAKAAGGSARFELRSRRLADAHGHITALVCAGDGTLYVGTFGGDVLGMRGDDVFVRQRLDGEVVSAIAFDDATDILWVGTEAGRIYRSGSRLRPVTLPASVRGPIHALAVDTAGQLWVATGGSGSRHCSSTPRRRGSSAASKRKRHSASSAMACARRSGARWRST